MSRRMTLKCLVNRLQFKCSPRWPGGVIISIFFLCVPLIIEAQPGSPFEKITTANGLPTNYIFCVQEDADGFMWAGSDKGLLRYNGVNWETYTKDNGLPGNYVTSIVSNNKGGFALSVSEFGYVWWNVNERKRYTLRLPKPYQATVIRGASITKNNTIFFNVYRNDSLFYFITGKQKPEDLELLCVYKLLPEAEGQLVEYKPEAGKRPVVTLLDRQNSFIENKYASYIYPTDAQKNKELLKNAHYVIPAENFLIGNDFIYKKNGADLQPWIKESFFENKNRQTNFLQTKNTLYISKMAEGLRIVKPGGVIEKYTLENGLSSNNINSIYLAKDSTIYISTLGGGINMLKKNYRIKYDLQDGPVDDIQESEGTIFASTKKNIYALSATEIKYKVVLQKEILSFRVAGNMLYTGNFEELKTQVLQKGQSVPKQNILFTAGISDIYVQQNEILASTYGSGIIKMKDESIIIKNSNYPFNNIEKLLKTAAGYIALSYESGFFTIDSLLQLQRYYQKKDGLLSNEIYFVHSFNDTLFVGGMDGITILDKFNNFKTISYTQGFKGTMARYIFTDNKGTHWVVSNKYLHKLSSDSLYAIGSAAVTLNDKDEINAAYFSSRLQKLFAGTTAGLCVIDVVNLGTDKKVEIPSIYKVMLGKKSLPLNRLYHLPFDYFTIAFHFNNISKLSHKNTILYKLEGYNTDWVPLADSLIVSFEKLRPGNYTLWAKGINMDGIASQPVKIGDIKVQQVTWLQWWMLLIYTILFGLGIYILMIVRQKKRFEKKSQELKLAQELETERQRISRDLHDNMGAYTTALLTNIESMETSKGHTPEIDKMKQNAGEILNSLKETIWVLNNKEISVRDFSDVFTTYCFKILANFEHIDFEVEEFIENNKLLAASDAIHLNRVLQELFQNSLKHSNCTKISYQIFSTVGLKIILADNGTGYREGNNKKGNGLENIQWRLKEINAGSEVFSSNGNGTQVVIKK